MRLNENQIKILDDCIFLKEAHKKILDLSSLSLVNSFSAAEMDKIDRDLRFTTFKKIERAMMVSQFYKDLYSVSLPNESKLHEEKLRYMRYMVGKNRDSLDYTDRLKFTFTILDPNCKYANGVYKQYSELNFESLLNDGRKIIKCIAGNFRILHQRNMKTLEQFEIYDAPNSNFVFKLCFYPHKKIWIELESRE